MPGVVLGGVKRKRHEGNGVVTSRKAAKAGAKGESRHAKVLLLEQQIVEGRTHYNNIVELQSLVASVAKKPKTATLAAVALCRVFCRLIAGEQLVKRGGAREADAQIVQWLRERVRAYVEALTAVWIGSPDAAQESTALTLLMRLVKEETSHESRRSAQAWRTGTGTFCSLVVALLEKTHAEGGRQEFVEKYVEEHDDVRFYTVLAIKQYFDKNRDAIADEHVANAIDILAQIEGVPQSEDQLEDWYGAAPLPENKQLVSLTAHRKTAQEAWLAIFRCGLSRNQRKRILGVATTTILPWFTTRIELLADFLADSFNEGGSISLLALSSIFHLMTQRNLDYPDFYTKLYSLLDQDVLHSKHRSRFFRLLDKFMSSTHLPATMVASFIKRLARLSLQAPPGAIVWIVPWTYNMLKQHPACAFMLHRTYHPAHNIYNLNPAYEETGIVKDTFDANETDPTATGAIDSSLWELETLSSHYHPNVATLAKILSEQFTKREYSLEDFLDHSYGTLLDNELSRALKKAPVVEWEIPKRIITSEEEGGGLNGIGKLLQKAINARA
ncbi:CBF-domain-containing protein [Teratosphaeria nubilosa]|uniref:CBF-domain-containing protein n=1 Tax=Teratosphaeria nubilosa TaxID=161662 RepID=A0A6G1LKD6_9PEZI|nr:CBF-domain-containing protein [Teratosphaeria nubilosa]